MNPSRSPVARTGAQSSVRAPALISEGPALAREASSHWLPAAPPSWATARRVTGEGGTRLLRGGRRRLPCSPRERPRPRAGLPPPVRRGRLEDKLLHERAIGARQLFGAGRSVGGRRLFLPRQAVVGCAPRRVGARCLEQAARRELTGGRRAGEPSARIVRSGRLGVGRLFPGPGGGTRLCPGIPPRPGLVVVMLLRGGASQRAAEVERTDGHAAPDTEEDRTGREPLSRSDVDLLDPRAVDPQAVRAAQVLQRERLACEDDPQVLARDGQIVDDDVALRIASEHGVPSESAQWRVPPRNLASR